MYVLLQIFNVDNKQKHRANGLKSGGYGGVSSVIDAFSLQKGIYKGDTK